MAFYDDLLGGFSSPDDTDFYGGSDSNDTSFGMSEKEKQNAGVYAPGYTSGSLTGMKDRRLSGQSNVRADQSNYERMLEQRGNYFYGGSATGREDAIAAARENVGRYQNTLGGYGSSFMGEMGSAGDRAAPIDAMNYDQHAFGTGGVFGAAGTLNDLAMQGPGPSQAQAQLDASSAAAMRQQLAIAGSGRGMPGSASAQRNAAQQQAQIQGGTNAQAAVLRAQEEAAWRDQQARMLGMSGDLYGAGAASALAGADYATGAQQQQTAMNDQYAAAMGGLAAGAQKDAGMLSLGAENLAHDVNMGGLTGSMGYEKGITDIYGIGKGVSVGQQQVAQQQDAADKSFYGSLLASISDVRAKKNIRPADDEVTATLRRLGVEQGEAAASAGQRSQAHQFSLDTGLGTPIDYDANAGIYRERDPLRTRGAEGARYKPRGADVPVLSANPFDARDASASAFEYRDPERHGQGQHFGPMAQELEQTPAGASTVIEQPDGTKAIDTGRLSLLNTSGLGAVQRNQDDFQRTISETNARVAELEALLDAEDKKKRKGKKEPKVDFAFGLNEPGEGLPKLDYEFATNEEEDAGRPVSYAY